MFVLLLIFFGLANCFVDTDSYGVNKTVGWAYDISNEMFFNAMILSFSQLLFLIGYLIVMLLGRKTNFYLSLTNFGLSLISIIALLLQCFTLSTISCLFAIPLFFVIILKSQKSNFQKTA